MTAKSINRREFLGKTALGAVSAGLGLPMFGWISTAQDKSHKIITRTLGRTGLEVPIVSFGIMNSDSPDLLRRAIELGITHLDTAHVYLRGNSETFIGKTLEEDGTRDKVSIATKMRFNRDRDRNVFLREDGRESGATTQNFNNQLELSLKRLRTDHVDILYLHSCYSPDMVSFEPMMNALVKAKKEGKTRFIGISTHANEPDCIREALKVEVYDVVLTAYNSFLDRKEAIKEAVAEAASKNIGVVAMKTHGGNQLNRDLEAKAKIDHAAAFKWVLNDPNVTTTIPGMTSFDQLQFNFKVMNDLAISAEEERTLDLAARHPGNPYCQSCRTCIPTCPQNVEIPNLMRAYMYAEGYGNLIQAEMTAAELPVERGLQACGSCPDCRALCPNGIDIAGKLKTLSDLGLAQA